MSARDEMDVRDEGRLPERWLLSIHLKQWVEWFEDAQKAQQGRQHHKNSEAISLGEMDTVLQVRFQGFRGLGVQTKAGPFPSSNDVI